MRRRGLARVVVLLVVAAQLLDLATFGLVAGIAGPAGEVGPLGDVYASGGFLPVAAVKGLAVVAVLIILALYARLVGSPRRLALLVVVIGLFGAVTNVVGIIDSGGSIGQVLPQFVTSGIG